MDILSTLIGYALKGAKKNKAVETATTDMEKALNNEMILLWKKIKSIFILEDKNLVEKIENNPDDKNAEAGLKYMLSEKLKDENFKNQMINIIHEIKKLKIGSDAIPNEQIFTDNSGDGSIVIGGKVKIGGNVKNQK